MAQPVLLSDDVASKLEVNERLLALDALTVGMVQSDMQEAYDYALTDSPTNDDEAQLRSLVIAQLQGELDVLAQEDPNASEPADQWPRQKAAIQRAYSFFDSDAIASSAQAQLSQARATILNNLPSQLGKSVGDFAKNAAQPLAGTATIVIVLIVVIVIAQIVRKT